MYKNNLNSFYGVVKTIASNDDFTDMKIYRSAYDELSEKWSWVVDTDPSSEGAYCMVGDVDSGMIFFPDYVTLSRNWFERTDISLDRKLSYPPSAWLAREAKELLKVLDWLLLAVIAKQISAAQAERLLEELMSVGRVPSAKNRLATGSGFWHVPFNGDWLGLYDQFKEGERLSNHEETILESGITPTCEFNPSAKYLNGTLDGTPIEGGHSVYFRNNGIDRPELIFPLPEDASQRYYGVPNYHYMLVLMDEVEKSGVSLNKPNLKSIVVEVDGTHKEYPLIVLPIWAATRRA